MKFPRLRLGLAWGASLAAGFAILLLLRLHVPSRPFEDAAFLDEPTTPDTNTYVVADTVHGGDTLTGLLFRNQLTYSEIGRVLQELRARQYFSPRRLMRGQTIEVTRDEYGRFVSLTYHVSPEEIYVFQMDSDPPRSFAQAVDSEVRVRKLAGTVQSTFEEAIIGAGGSCNLAGKLADIYSCQVDFFTEVQRGDQFSLLVEERYVEGQRVGFGEVLYGRYSGREASAECVYFRPTGGKGGYYDRQGRSLRGAFLKSPLNYRRISSFFSKARFHPILKRYRPHHGVDYAASEGTPVVAVADGTVEFAGWKGGYGLFVKIRHDRTHETCYGHLSRLASGIRSGGRVKQGQRVGSVGRTGLATGPHLHYELIENGRSIDPLRRKEIPSEPIPTTQLAEFTKIAGEMFRADERIMAGSCLEPEAWLDLLAQNLAEPQPASD